MSPFVLVAPETVEQAIAELGRGARGSAAPLAGGTDLLLDLDERRIEADRVVSLRRLPWRTLAWDGPVLTIGSTLPLRALEADRLLAARHPALLEAVRAVGGVALRHRATLGGNLGRSAPASDLVPVLLALDAEVEVVGPSGPRAVPVDRFVRASRETALARAELIRSVRLPEPRPSAYLWQRVRPANDISQLSVAVAFSPSDRRWRVALGGVPPRPVLVPEAAAALREADPGDAEVREAASAMVAHRSLVRDRRASDEYRRRLVGVLLARAVRAATGPRGAPG
jgi:CO/xanthine dehydrogenase FAD-binding subunit